ncbi:hypothetical protein C8R44DRAFT_329669 [Mycena epipterygia]|nr:hypothetical protein C8R44DRAFT_329669 [Mycena epipterygia]
MYWLFAGRWSFCLLPGQWVIALYACTHHAPQRRRSSREPQSHRAKQDRRHRPGWDDWNRTGVAGRLAKLGCSRVIILGRNETRGNGVLGDMKKPAPQESKIEDKFVKGDLSDSKGMRAVAESIQTIAGDGRIDYLVRRSGLEVVT